MAAGALIGGTFAGIAAAGAALGAGQPALVALAAWAVVGSVATLGIALALFLRADAREAAARAAAPAARGARPSRAAEAPLAEPVEG